MHQPSVVTRERATRRPILSAAVLVIAASALLLAPHTARAADASADAATVWDYRTIFVVWDEEAQDWRADWTGGPSTTGLEAVLDAEGAVGWELVDIAHERFDTVESSGATSEEARRLRLIFKRPGTTAAVAPLVAISGFSFQPPSLEVGVGTTVEWENQDPTAHTTTSSDRSFDSGVLSPGGVFEFTFDAAGTYAYACVIHPSMTGTVVVS